MVTDGILWRSELKLQQRQAAAVGIAAPGGAGGCGGGNNCSS